MYAVVHHLQFDTSADRIIALMRSDGLPLLASHPGFIDFMVIREGEQRVTLIILWANEASAAAGAMSFGPAWFGPNVKPHLVGPEARSVGEVVIHHGGAEPPASIH